MRKEEKEYFGKVLLVRNLHQQISDAKVKYQLYPHWCVTLADYLLFIVVLRTR